MYILDEDNQMVSPGDTGELVIGGVGVGRHYLNRPEQNEKSFLKDPFSNDPTARLYKSGDLVSVLPDGRILYKGRSDNQVKINGFRIELGEIEHILQDHPMVNQAACKLYESAGHKKIAAYLTGNSALDKDEIQRYSEENLPSYMMPSIYIFQDKIPVNHNGKIDRNALPEPVVTSLGKREIILPANNNEIILTTIWQELFGIEKIGVQDNFFYLGGDSLMSVRMINRANEAGLNLNLYQFFENPTIEALAKSAIKQKAELKDSILIPINPAGNKSALFAIPAGDGNYKEYNSLSNMLGDAQPVYYFLPNGNHDNKNLLSGIGDIARKYCEEIHIAFPDGEINLIGFSFGGFIAYEMARQLTEQGRKVSNLILLDVYIQDSFYPIYKGSFLGRKSKRLKYIVRSGIKKNLAKRISARLPDMNDTDIVWSFSNDPIIKILGSYSGDFKPWMNLKKGDYKVANNIAYHAYEFREYIGNITLVKAQDHPAPDKKYDPSMGWKRFSNFEKINFIEVPGHHDSMMKEPYFANIAKIVKEVLDKN